MSPVVFLAWSGALAWCWLVWRAVLAVRGLAARMRWAVLGPRKPVVQAARARR